MSKVLESLLGDFEYLMMALSLLGVMYLCYYEYKASKGEGMYGDGTSNHSIRHFQKRSDLGFSGRSGFAGSGAEAPIIDAGDVSADISAYIDTGHADADTYETDITNLEDGSFNTTLDDLGKARGDYVDTSRASDVTAGTTRLAAWEAADPGDAPAVAAGQGNLAEFRRTRPKKEGLSDKHLPYASYPWTAHRSGMMKGKVHKHPSQRSGMSDVLEHAARGFNTSLA